MVLGWVLVLSDNAGCVLGMYRVIAGCRLVNSQQWRRNFDVLLYGFLGVDIYSLRSQILVFLGISNGLNIRMYIDIF